MSIQELVFIIIGAYVLWHLAGAIFSIIENILAGIFKIAGCGCALIALFIIGSILIGILGG